MLAYPVNGLTFWDAHKWLCDMKIHDFHIALVNSVFVFRIDPFTRFKKGFSDIFLTYENVELLHIPNGSFENMRLNKVA